MTQMSSVRGRRHVDSRTSTISIKSDIIFWKRWAKQRTQYIVFMPTRHILSIKESRTKSLIEQQLQGVENRGERTHLDYHRGESGGSCTSDKSQDEKDTSHSIVENALTSIYSKKVSCRWRHGNYSIAARELSLFRAAILSDVVEEPFSNGFARRNPHFPIERLKRNKIDLIDQRARKIQDDNAKKLRPTKILMLMRPALHQSGS